jgi:hypothetical protein
MILVFSLNRDKHTFLMMHIYALWLLHLGQDKSSDSTYIYQLQDRVDAGMPTSMVGIILHIMQQSYYNFCSKSMNFEFHI